MPRRSGAKVGMGASQPAQCTAAPSPGRFCSSASTAFKMHSHAARPSRSPFSSMASAFMAAWIGKPGSQRLGENGEPSLDPLAVHAEVASPVNGAAVNGER